MQLSNVYKQDMMWCELMIVYLSQINLERHPFYTVGSYTTYHHCNIDKIVGITIILFLAFKYMIRVP